MRQKIALFGGSFDPVHAGHIHIAAEAQKAFGLDEVIFLPAACSPFKMEHTAFLSEEQRLELLAKATQAYPWAKISRADLDLPAPSWTYRLVEHWRSLAPDAELYWILGTDQWEKLEEWKNIDYLAQELHFLVYHRQSPPTAKAGFRASFIAGDHPASSSAIREAIHTGESIPAHYLAEGTQDYF